MAGHCPPELMLFQVCPCQSSTGVLYWTTNKARAVHPHREGFRQTAQGREALSDVPHALPHRSKPQTTSHRHTCTDSLKWRHFVGRNWESWGQQELRRKGWGSCQRTESCGFKVECLLVWETSEARGITYKQKLRSVTSGEEKVKPAR